MAAVVAGDVAAVDVAGAAEPGSAIRSIRIANSLAAWFFNTRASHNRVARETM